MRARKVADVEAPARASVAALIARCSKISASRDDWACRSRRVETVVDGVRCFARVKAEAIRQDGAAPRVTCDVFVYLTATETCEEVGGIGWVHFVVAEEALAHCAGLYDCAFAQARAQLRSKPRFAALAEREALLAHTPARSRDAPPRRL